MKNVKIIGAGIAGLSAGCFLQMNGYKTEIFELHNRAGGLCTSWKRGDYLIDGCIHWWELWSHNYPILDALLDMNNFPKVIYNEFSSIQEGDEILHHYGNLDCFEKELKRVSPEDGEVIEQLIAGAKELSQLQIPADKAPEIMSSNERLKFAENFRKREEALSKWNITIGNYSKNLKSLLIKKLLISFPFTAESLMSDFLLHCAVFHNKNACYPIGGADELTNRLVQYYESLGGKIHYNSKVSKILTKDNCAEGILLSNGSKHLGDYIISAADGRHTVCDLLEGSFIDESITDLYYSGKYVPTISQIYVSLGVARTFKNSFKPYVFVPFKNSLKIGDEQISQVGVTVHNFDPTAAPEGKTLLTMMIPVKNPENWSRLRKENKNEYEKHKKNIAEFIIEELDTYFGDVKNKIEMIDVATPATYIRYTNNWNGAAMAWGEMSRLRNKPKKEISGLKNFLMCGHWVGDLGLSNAAKSGRDIAQILCKRDNREFIVCRQKEEPYYNMQELQKNI